MRTLAQMDFHGEPVVVTGAASGIGRACCLELAELGADLALVDVVGEGLAETQRGLEDLGIRVCSVVADVTRETDAGRAARTIEAEYGYARALLNVAGTNHSAKLEDLDYDQWRRVLDVDLTSVYLMCRAFLPLLQRAEGGAAVVNVASTFGLIGNPSMPVYCAAKGGVIGLTRQLAVDYGPQGIRFNAVCPGPTLTPRLERNIEAGVLDGEALAAQALPGRMADPGEIARAIVFLASPAASYIHGAAVVVDGGQTAHTGRVE